MLDPSQKEFLDSAYQRGREPGGTLAARMASLDPTALDFLGSYAILGLKLDIVGVQQFFEWDDIFLPDHELLHWLAQCLEQNLLQLAYAAGDDTPRFVCPEEVFQYFSSHLNPGELELNHLRAARFLTRQFALFAAELGVTLPEGGDWQVFLTQPNGFLDQIAHLPQHQELHQSTLDLALNWQEHLFQLGKFKESANILNSICFALSRRGQRKLAEDLLTRIASRAQGLIHLAARINLATLLREESKHAEALLLYWRLLPGLLEQRAWPQLAQVLAEMAAIYRSRGHLLGSAMILEFCVLLNGWLKNGQSQAIARSQLASTYRYLHMYLQAANVAQHAIAYFRRSDDRLNLGRTLLTQGNIHENLGRIERAMTCFDEALRIGQQIADPQATVGAMSGKARALMRLDHLDEAKALLDEAISLRKRRGDHAVGFEYQNLGLLYEKKDNLAVALSWHKKALKEFEQYMPLEVERCSNRIAVLEGKLEKRLQKSRR